MVMPVVPTDVWPMNSARVVVTPKVAGDARGFLPFRHCPGCGVFAPVTFYLKRVARGGVRGLWEDGELCGVCDPPVPQGLRFVKTDLCMALAVHDEDGELLMFRHPVTGEPVPCTHVGMRAMRRGVTNEIRHQTTSTLVDGPDTLPGQTNLLDVADGGRDEATGV